MKLAQRMLCCALVGSALLSTAASAASWQESLSSAATQFSQNNDSQQGGLSLSSLGGLLNGGNQALSADNMNNAAGILQYCAKNKLASVTNAENVKNQVMEKLGLSTPAAQQQDTNYLDGLQGLLNTKEGEQLSLSNIGNSPLAEKVKTKACDIVLKQGIGFLS